MEFPIPRRYQKRADRKDPRKYVGGRAEVLVWEEYFELCRRGKGPKRAFVLAMADALSGKYTNPFGWFFHPIKWRAYEFGKKFVQFFAVQANAGAIPDLREFVRLHVEPLGV